MPVRIKKPLTKKAIILPAVAAVLIATIIVALSIPISPEPTPQGATTLPVQQAQKALDKTLTETQAEGWGRITIPSIGVDAKIETVGLDAKKNMDVPKDPQNVGWYRLGNMPGEKGNAVMAGHVTVQDDNKQSKPGIFLKLDDLKNGDQIMVVRKDKKLTYEVTASNYYHKDNFPLQDVFDGQKVVSQLQLITCESFDKASSSYSHRRVITAKLAP